MVRRESGTDKGKDRHQPGLHQSLAAIEGGRREARDKSWRLQKRPEETGFHHCGLEKTQLGIERDFTEGLGMEEKPEDLAWRGSREFRSTNRSVS